MVVRAGDLERLVVRRVARSRDEGPAGLAVLEVPAGCERVVRRVRPRQEDLAAGGAVAPAVVVGEERRRGAAGGGCQQRYGDRDRRTYAAGDGVELHGGWFPSVLTLDPQSASRSCRRYRQLSSQS